MKVVLIIDPELGEVAAPVIPALGRLRQEACMGYIARTCLKNLKKSQVLVA
jgi:hypothetical protein